MKLLLIFLVILLISGFMILTNENIKLTSINSIVGFGNSYSSLLVKEYSNAVKITGNLIKFFSN